MLPKYEYCPACGESVESELVRTQGAYLVYCPICHRFIKFVPDEDKEYG